MRAATRTTIAGGTLAVLLAATASPVAAQSSADLERRLTIVERKLDNAALGQLYNQLQRLQQEVQQLRGEVDLLNRRMQAMEDRQRDIYVDLDSRLRKLETTAPPAAAPGADIAPPTSGATGAPTGAPPVQPPPPAAPQLPVERENQGVAPEVETGISVAAEAPYQQAFETLKTGRYEEAAAQFKSYLEQYPDSPYADNARYWLGESYYVVREFDEAVKHFQRVLESYPQSSKRADALLKIGFIYYEQGKLDQSRETLEKVVRQYPDSTVAGLARRRLERIGQ